MRFPEVDEVEMVQVRIVGEENKIEEGEKEVEMGQDAAKSVVVTAIKLVTFFE